MKKEKKDDHDLGNEEESVYSESVREDLIESGEISAEEEGFMAGYDEAEEEGSKEEDEEEDKEKKEKKDAEEDEEDY